MQKQKMIQKGKEIPKCKTRFEEPTFFTEAGQENSTSKFAKESLSTAAETPKKWSEQRRNTWREEEVAEKMGEKESVEGLWSLSEKNGALFLVLVFEMKRMRKEEENGQNLAFL